MAQFTFTNNTYAGEALAGFMASTLLEADSVKRGLLTVIDDVKARKIILDIDDSVVLQNPSGIFADQGTTALQTETYLDPVVFEFMKQEQYDNLKNSWENSGIKPGSFADYDAPIDLADFMVERYLAKIQIANERLYWLGKANVKECTFSAAFTGLLPSISAASGVYKVSLAATPALAGTLTVATISAAGLVTLSASQTVLQNGDVVTISAVTGAIADTVYGAVSGESYFINNVTSTTFTLQMNYNDVQSQSVVAAFTGTSTGATISFINASNVIPVFQSIYSTINYAVRVKKDFKLFVPLHVAISYKQAQANKALNVLGAFTSDKELEYLGQAMEPMNYWLGNTIMAGRVSNLFLGVDLLGDQSELTTVYLKPFTGDNVVRMKARMKAATCFKFAKELFYLTF